MLDPSSDRDTNDNGEARVIAETGAIAEYLVEKCGRLGAQINYVEAQLASRPEFAGRAFNAADVMMSFPLEAARDRAGISQETHPNLFKWVDVIHARPTYKSALAKGGPYAYA